MIQTTVYSKPANSIRTPCINHPTWIPTISQVKPSLINLTSKILILIFLFSLSSSYICDFNCSEDGCDPLTGQCTNCITPYYLDCEPILDHNTCILCQISCKKCSTIDGYRPYCLECSNGVKPIDGYCPDCKGVGVCNYCLQNKYWFDVVSKRCIKDTSFTDCALLGLDASFNPVCQRCNKNFYPNKYGRCVSIPSESGCEQGYSDISGKCTGYCVKGYYRDRLTYKCLLCAEHCSSCSGPATVQCFMCKAGYYLNEDSKCLSCQQKYNTCSEYDPIFVSPYLCNVEAGFIFDAKYEDCTYSSSLKGLCTLMEDGMCQLCRPPLVQMLEEEDKVVCIDSRANCKVHLTSVGNLNLIAHCYVCNLGFYGAGEGATEDIMELAGGTNRYCLPCPEGCTYCSNQHHCTYCDLENTYYQDGLCKQCSSECQSCYGPGQQCLICQDGTRAFKGKCGQERDQLREVAKKSKEVASKWRFHHWIIYSILGLTIFSVCLRTTLYIWETVEVRKYLNRLKNQKRLWILRKKALTKAFSPKSGVKSRRTHKGSPASRQTATRDLSGFTEFATKSL